MKAADRSQPGPAIATSIPWCPVSLPSFSEKNIVFTGTLNQMSRSEAKYKAEELGAKVVSSVTKNTDYVIVGADSGKKEKIAKELNIKTLNENEWIKFISK